MTPSFDFAWSHSATSSFFLFRPQLNTFRSSSLERGTTRTGTISLETALRVPRGAGRVVGALRICAEVEFARELALALWDEEAGVFRILEVWETHEEADRFRRERLIPAIEQGPANPDNTAPPDREAATSCTTWYAGPRLSRLRHRPPACSSSTASRNVRPETDPVERRGSGALGGG